MNAKSTEKKVFVPFLKYGEDKKTWPSKEDYAREFMEFRWSDKNKNHSIAFAKDEWLKMHLGAVEYKIYLKRKNFAYILRLRRAMSKRVLRPKRH